uniref:Neprosin PEP catalytic domain-containing protein n=1 Tax=Brassica oleracea var. oleracea TaxID=109376 RepID=A0A0D3CNU6_BRAOL
MINQIIVTCVLGILIIPAIVIDGEFSDTHDAKIDLLLKKLDKPAVKSIKMKPSGDPDKWNNDTSNIVTQLWTINGKCPQNTIPIRRTTREDILRAESIESYGKKYPNNIPRRKPANSTNEIHEYATLRVNGIFRGAEAVINVWKPYVQMPREFSLAQMWLVAGPPSNLNTIEFGWQADGYRSGCYNLDCPGFVPVNQACLRRTYWSCFYLRWIPGQGTGG